MPVLQASGIADLITTTLNELGEMKFTDIMSDYQNTIFFKRLMKKNKTTFDAGPAVQWNLITDTNGSTRAVGLYYTANVNPTNVMTTAQVPWRHVTANWAVDRREIAMNRAPRKIVDLVKTRRLAMLGDVVKFFEQRGWRVPASTDTENIYGVPYYVVKSATDAATDTTNFGFNGTHPSGYSDVAGLSATTYPRWANYADKYTALTKDDFVAKLWRAMTWTDFTPLVDDIPQYNTGDDYGLYTTYNVIAALKQILEAQNDDLGPDIDSMEGKVAMRRTPFTWVRELENDTTGPVYGLNWGTLKGMGLRGEFGHVTEIAQHDSQPTVTATHHDWTWNLYCTDRRRQFVLATGTTMPA